MGWDTTLREKALPLFLIRAHQGWILRTCSRRQIQLLPLGRGCRSTAKGERNLKAINHNCISQLWGTAQNGNENVFRVKAPRWLLHNVIAGDCLKRKPHPDSSLSTKSRRARTVAAISPTSWLTLLDHLVLLLASSSPFPRPPQLCRRIWHCHEKTHMISKQRKPQFATHRGKWVQWMHSTLSSGIFRAQITLFIWGDDAVPYHVWFWAFILVRRLKLFLPCEKVVHQILPPVSLQLCADDTWLRTKLKSTAKL